MYVRFLSIKKLHLQNTRYGDLFSPICQHSPFRSLYKGVSGNIWLRFYQRTLPSARRSGQSQNKITQLVTNEKVNIAATMVLILNYKQHHKAFNILVLLYHDHCDTLTPSKFHFALQCYLVLNLSLLQLKSSTNVQIRTQ